METSTVGRWQDTLRMSAAAVVALFFVSFSFMAAAEGKVSRIDTHTHCVPPFYRDLLISKGITAGGLGIPKWNVDDHLSFMDSNNIDISVLSVSLPGARLTPFDSVEDSRKLARQLNDYGHMIVTTYPKRFQWYATLPLPDVEGSIAEAIYALDTLKTAGVVLLANTHGEYLGNPKLDPLMEVLDARGATVFIHPSTLACAPVVNDVEGEKVNLPTYLVDFLLDTTRAAVNLATMKVPIRYPNIKFILAHGGGFLPFAAYRVTRLMSYTTGEPIEKFLPDIQNFYVETALSASPSSLPSILGIIPHDHISFGSDYPYAPTAIIEEFIKSLEEFPLEEETRHQIDFHCANRLFEKPLQHWRSIWHQEPESQLQKQLADW